MADTTKPADHHDTVRAAPLVPRPVGRPPNQHVDRATEPTKPAELSLEDRERFEELRAKTANPNVLPPNVRTEDEEHEFRDLSARVSDEARAAALEAARPEARPNPKQRFEALKAKGQNLGEGETIELARIEGLIKDEARVDELKAMDKRVPEEDAELDMLQTRVAEARAAGGFDPNG